MMGSWVISSVIRFSSNGIMLMRGLTAEATKLNTVLDTQASKIQRAQAALESYRSKMTQVGAAAAGGMALAGAAFTAYGVMGAAQLERSLTAVQIATRNYGRQSLQQYASLAFQTSAITAQNVNTIAKEMAMAASAGLNDPRQLRDAFTRIAKAADVLWMSPKHIEPVQAVQQMSTLAHLFGTYSGQPLQHMLDRASEMMFVQPEALQKLVTQGRVFIGSARAAGVSEEDIFKQAMTMGQTGFLQGRGGSGIARVIEYLSGAATMTGHLSKLQHAALFDLGLTTAKGPSGTLRAEYLNHGNLLLQKVVDHLEQIRGKFTATGFVGELQRAFLAQGGRFMATELQPSIYNKASQNWAAMNAIGTVDSMWDKYRHNFIYQWSVFWTNLQNIPKAIFFPLLPQLTNLFETSGKALGNVVAYLAKNPDAAKRWGEGIIAFTITMGVIWAAFTAKLAWSAIQMPIQIARMTTALDALTATIGTDATKIGVSSGAAAGGLGALASSLAVLLGALSSVGILVGIAKEARDAAHSKVKAAQTRWATGGASNRGGLPPGTAGTVDIFGRPLPGYHSPSQFGTPRHAPLHASTGHTTVHVAHVEINFPNVKDGAGAKVAMEDLWLNPRSTLYTSALGTRTHPNLPQPLTVAPA